MGGETKVPDAVRILAEQQGLQTVLEQFPDAVNAAAERGLRPLSEVPDLSPLMAPAPVFNPTQFEPRE